MQRLSDAGVDQAHQLLTSAQAGATLIESGERVLICAGPGVEQAVSEAGGVPIANEKTPLVSEWRGHRRSAHRV